MHAGVHIFSANISGRAGAEQQQEATAGAASVVPPPSTTPPRDESSGELYCNDVEGPASTGSSNPFLQPDAGKVTCLKELVVFDFLLFVFLNFLLSCISLISLAFNPPLTELMDVDTVIEETAKDAAAEADKLAAEEAAKHAAAEAAKAAAAEATAVEAAAVEAAKAAAAEAAKTA